MSLQQHPVYRHFNNLKTAITNPKNTRYKNYGGAGVIMQPEWLYVDGFRIMCDALSYDPDDPAEADIFKSIQRIDIDGDYTEDNCYLSRHTFVGIKRSDLQRFVDMELSQEDTPSPREPNRMVGSPRSHTATLVSSTITANALAGVDTSIPLEPPQGLPDTDEDALRAKLEAELGFSL